MLIRLDKMRLDCALPSNAVAGLQGVEVKGQLGFFAEWMPGANPEKWSKEQKRQWVNRIPIEWVRQLPQQALILATLIWVSMIHWIAQARHAVGSVAAACSSESAFAFLQGIG